MGRPEHWEARKKILWSYGHKALLLAVACLGFIGLRWLASEKRELDKSRKTRWAVSAVVPQISVAVGLCPRSFPNKNAEGFESRDQLIAAIQDRAEECVWEDFRTRIAEAYTRLETLGKDPSRSAARDSARYADFIAKEEGLARLRAITVRQKVKSILVNVDLQPTRPAGLLADMTDDESGLHVIYEISWYFFLLLGVAASSMLFLLVITVLPITDGEGYWTKRIGDILERVTPAGHSLALPFLAAAVAGGTLAGAVAATEPGGQARSVLERERAVYVQPKIEVPPPRPPEGPPPSIDPLVVLLNRIAEDSEALAKETRDAKYGIVKAVEEAAGDVRKGATDAAASVNTRVACLQESVSDVERQTTHVDLRVASLEGAVAQGGDTIEQHSSQTVQSAKAVEDRETDQAAASRRALAQSAEIDSRGFFERWFGGRLYKIRPLVPLEMSARLELNQGLTRDDAKRVREALAEMAAALPAVPRKDFEDKLQKGLRDRLAPQLVAVLERQENLKALLRICKVPRR